MKRSNTLILNCIFLTLIFCLGNKTFSQSGRSARSYTITISSQHTKSESVIQNGLVDTYVIQDEDSLPKYLLYVVVNFYDNLDINKGFELLSNESFKKSMMERLDCQPLAHKKVTYQNFSAVEFEVIILGERTAELPGRLIVAPNENKFFYILFMGISKAYLDQYSDEITKTLNSITFF